MDAGVLQLHVFPHEPAAHRPQLLGPGERLVASLSSATPIERTTPVSLVVPTFFNKSLKNCSLQYLLEGLQESTAVEEVVLVVAGDSADAHEHSVAVPGSKKVVYVPCEPNQRARARNLGAAAASHDVLLFLDDDMVLESWKTVDVFVSQLLTENFDCALFPRRNYARFPLLYDPAALRHTIAEWRAEDSCIDESLVFDPVRHGCPFKTMAFCFPGCFMLIRKDAFELIGGFPQEFEGWGFEDSDFAVRATSVLKVLNLFRKSHALLHIDHPVSPYKSEEYEKNFHRFLAAHSMSDVDRLCAHVISGEDFLDGTRPSESHSTYFAPLHGLAESGELPFLQEETTRRTILHRYEQILEKRLEKEFDALPQYVLLHGSRGEGTATSSSDFDLLFLFRGGNIREFFTCSTRAGQSVDFEFSDCAKFEGIAQRPVLYPLYGPLELAKLASGKLLVGDAEDWQQWVQRQLHVAICTGRMYWLLYALGISLRKEKLGPLRTQFLNSLRGMLVRSDAVAYQADIALLDNFQVDLAGPYLRTRLDAEQAGWRDDMLHQRRVFAFQVPEVWSALEWLVSG